MKILIDHMIASRLALLALCFGVAYVAWLIVARLLLSPIRHFPGPKWAALTDWWDIYHIIKCDRFRVIQELHENHGPVVRVGPNQLSFTSPKTFQHVYVVKAADFRKSDFYASIQPGVGPEYSGLFNYCDHQQAMAERKDLQPAFSSAALREYELRFDKHIDIIIAKIKDLGELDMFRYFKYLLVDAIGDLALDQGFGQLESGEDHQYMIDFNNAFTLIGLQSAFSWLIPFVPYLPSKTIKDAHAGLDRLFKYAQKRVDTYLSKPEKRRTMMQGYLDVKTGQPKEPYTPWYVALSGHGFIVAGSESSAITLTYLIWIMVRRPEIQARIREEIQSLPQEFYNAELCSLPYLDAVLRETLRIYPPAPASMPRVVPASGLVMEGVTYPPGTVIGAQPYSVHRDTELFEEPESFRPERWLEADPNKKEQMLKAFVPFSAGARGCIGRGVAWMQILRTLVRILQEFQSIELTRGMTDEDMVLVERGALAKPQGGKLWVRFKAQSA